MKKQLSTKQKIIGLLFIFSLGVQFLISYDSYTHDLTEHTDSAWFFTCGKAWMNGLIPYIDFADSKGPLLWLIYGIGYLISHYDYTGVFWLSVINYTIVLYYSYLIFFIFLKDHKKALWGSILMLSVYFCPLYHAETRAEDWCMPFIVLALFHSCRIFYDETSNSPKSIFAACLALGISLGGTLLIKYNMTIMLGAIALYMLYYIIHENQNITLSFVAVLLGFLLIVGPFIIYMLIVDCLEAFVNEYFLNTIQTIESYNNSSTYMREWLFLTYDAHHVLLFAIGCFGAYLMRNEVKKYRWFFLIAFLGFYAVAIHHSKFLHFHYLASCLPLTIWLCIALIKRVNRVTYSILTIITTVTFYTIVGSLFRWGYLTQNLFFINSQTRNNYYNVVSYLSVIKNPTITYYKTVDHGYGVPTGSLPATRYWATQTDATPEMLKSIHESIRQRISDFVLTSDALQSFDKSDSILTSAGYRLLYQFELGPNNYTLYTKHPIKKPNETISISNADVLFKRNHFVE